MFLRQLGNITKKAHMINNLYTIYRIVKVAKAIIAQSKLIIKNEFNPSTRRRVVPAIRLPKKARGSVERVKIWGS
jgi:hypothetical protein